MFFNNPEEFENFLKPVAGDTNIRPVKGSSFNAEICIKKLQYAGLFSISANSFKVIKNPQEDFFGLTIPLSSPFTITDSGKEQSYNSTTAHMLLPDHSFNLSAHRNCHFLVSSFLIDPINNYSNKLLQSDTQLNLNKNSDIPLTSYSGGLLLTSIAKAWSALNSEELVSDIALKELEDDLISSIVLYSGHDNDNQYLKRESLYRLSRTEEYIRENLKTSITRDQLAEVSGCSIRTLSRAFEKKYGFGPKAFIKKCRLNSSYLELLSLDKEMTTVTQVAFDYGFKHFGKFAIEYKNMFGESPSTSLMK